MHCAANKSPCWNRLYERRNVGSHRPTPRQNMAFADLRCARLQEVGSRSKLVPRLYVRLVPGGRVIEAAAPLRFRSSGAPQVRLTITSALGALVRQAGRIAAPSSGQLHRCLVRQFKHTRPAKPSRARRQAVITQVHSGAPWAAFADLPTKGSPSIDNGLRD
jgi:hypothetical protein